MKQVTPTLILLAWLCMLASVPLASAQNLKRIVILPFETSAGAQAYTLGLPIALERSFNTLDGVFVAPVGDVYLNVKRLESQNQFSEGALAQLYNAGTLISGRMSVQNGNAQVQLGFVGPQNPNTQDVFVQGDANNPNALVIQVAQAAADHLGLVAGSAELQQMQQVLAQTPSLEVLEPLSLASAFSRLADVGELVTAEEMQTVSTGAPSSSWALSEYGRFLSRNAENGINEALQQTQSAITYAPADIEALITHGALLQALNRRDEALAAFEQAIAINPAHPIALSGRARLGSDIEAAKRDFEQAILAYPRYETAYLGLAALQRVSNDPRALQTLQQGAAQLPNSVALQRAIIQEAGRQGDVQGALSYLQQLLSRSNEPSVYGLAATLPDSVLANALTIVQQGQSRFPKSIDPLLAEAVLYERQDNPQAALSALERARAIAPTSQTVLNQLAIGYARNGQLDQARSVIEGIPSLQNDDLQFNLAQIYLQANQNDAAIEVMDRLQSALASDVEFLNLYTIALARVGRLDQAKNTLDRALSLEPDNARSLALRQELEGGGIQAGSLGVGSVAELREQALIGASISPLNETQQLYFDNALRALGEGNFEGAIGDLAIARQYGDNAMIAFYEAYALQANGQLSEAIPRYEFALQYLPQSATILNNLGFAYYSSERYDEALSMLERSTAASNDYIDAWLNLGLVNYSLGRAAEAAQALTQALTLEPSLADVRIAPEGASDALTLAEMAAQAREGTLVTAPATTSSTSFGSDLPQSALLDGAGRPLTDQNQQLLTQGLQYLETQRFADAVTLFAQARSTQDTAVTAFYHAFALHATGDIENAIEGYERAKRDLPNNDTLLNNLGFAYHLAGLNGEALINLEKAASLSPDSANVLFNLGVVSYDLERYAEAARALGRAVELEPNLAQVAVNLGGGNRLTVQQMLNEARRLASSTS